MKNKMNFKAARKNYFPPGSLRHDFKLPIQNSKKFKYIIRKSYGTLMGFYPT
jgi:hypothetical protein